MKSTALFLVFLWIHLTADAQNTFPYSFNTNSVYITLVGGCTQAAALQLPDPVLTPENIEALNVETINKFDRNAPRQFSPSANTQSDYTLGIVMVAPSAIAASELGRSGWNHALIYSGMYLETFLLTNGVKDLTKDIVQRTRPLFYNSDLSLDERAVLAAAGDGRTSFYSGHTAVAFSSAVFLASTYDELYDNKTVSRALWTSSIGLATATGYLRFKAGKHFPSDILTGAIIGTAIGYWVPKAHLSGTKNWTLTPGTNSLTLQYHLR